MLLNFVISSGYTEKTKMTSERTMKDVNIVLIGATSYGKSTTGNALLGKAISENSSPVLSRRQQSETRSNSKCYLGQEGSKMLSRRESASRCGRQITVVHTEDILDDADLRETKKEIKAEVKTGQKKKKIKVVIFYTVYGKFTKDDDYMLDKLICDLDYKTRNKLFIVLTDYAENVECSRISCKKKLPIIHVKSSFTGNENEDQLKEIIKQILKGTPFGKKKSGAVIIPWICSTKFVLLLVLSFLNVLEAKFTDGRRNAEHIEIHLMTKPVVLGEDVDLECTITAENPNKPMSWTKIPHGDIIALNKITRDVKKYDIQVEYYTSKVAYKLKIKHFNMSDANCLYRCDFGFISAGDKLIFNDKDYISLPSLEDVESNFSLADTQLSGSIQIKNGYPAPTCTGDFQGQNISEMSISNKNDSVLFNTRIEIKHRTTSCKGTIMVTCSYGMRVFHFSDKVNECSDTNKERSHSIDVLYIVISVPCVLFFILIFAIIFFMKRKCGMSDKRSGETNEQSTKLCKA